MLSEVIDYINKGNTIITGPSGNGITSLTLAICNRLLNENKLILYYNSTGEIDKIFLKQYYPRTYNNLFFLNCSISNLLMFLEYIDFSCDYLIADPADSLMVNKDIIPKLIKLCSEKVLFTSQIRMNPNTKQLYSPIEEVNKVYAGNLFKYSIWLRNVTQPSLIYKERYLDIYDKYRIGNQYLKRFIIKFNIKNGNIVGL